jgi:hypothetical protein
VGARASGEADRGGARGALRQRIALLPAAAWTLWWISLVEVGVRALRLPRLVRLLGVQLATNPLEPQTPRPPQLSASELRRLRALDAIAPRWPFCEGPCLRKALVGGRALRKHHPQLCLGISPSSNTIDAHAWLELEDLGTIGYDGAYVALHRSPEHSGESRPAGDGESVSDGEAQPRPTL